MAQDPWAIDNLSGAPAYSAQEVRLAMAAMFAGAGASIGARSGVRLAGSGSELLVAAQASPNMTVKVNPGQCVVQSAVGSTQGPYIYTLDAVTNVTIGTAHATLDRIDLIAIRIRDANIDTSGQRDGQPVVVPGTNGGGVPALPTDATYLTLAQVAVTHGHTSIVAGDITDKRVYLAALGGILPCLSTNRPFNVPDGQGIYELDTGLTYRWRSSLNKYLRDLQHLTLGTQYTNNTTAFTDTGFAFFGEANSVYVVDSWLHTVAPTAADLSLQWVLPSGASIEWTLLGPASSNGGTTVDTTIWQGATTTTGPLTIGGMASAGTTGIIRGTITLGANSGTCKLQGAQVVASGSSFIRTSSWMTTRQTG